MSKPEIIYHPEQKHFSIGELVGIGRRLTKAQLEDTRLFSYVEKAEKENVQRLRSIMDLIKPLTHISPEVSKILLLELERAESQLSHPVRGPAREVGRTPKPEGRTLPPPGTLYICSHKYRPPKWREVKGPNGTRLLYPISDTFKFLVVKQPCKLVCLNDPDGPIYRNPSIAARKATGNQTNGWEFF